MKSSTANAQGALAASSARAGQEPATSHGDWQIYKRLLSYVRPYWALFVLAVIGFLIGSGAEAYFAKLLGDLIDNWDASLSDASWVIPTMIFAAALARGLGEIIGEVLLSQISFGVVHKIRTQLFNQLLLLPSAYFDASSQGHLVSRLTYNVSQLRDTGTDALKSIIQDGGKVIVYLGYMLFLSWKLTLIFVATAPVMAIVAVYASRRFRRISKRIQNSMGDVTHVASETVSGYRVVRIFGGEDYEKERFNKSSRTNRRQNLKMVATKVTSTQTIQIFVAMALAILIGLLFRPELGGALSRGQVVTFLGLAALLARPIRKLSEVNARLQRGLAAAEDIFGQMNEAPESDLGQLSVERVGGRLEFRNVSFSYEQGPGEVLSDLNFVIEPGQTVALVGKSGSGKSTVASLIPRFYEPSRGEILLDGEPLSSYQLRSLRRQIALVTQQVTLFNDTLERNIAYGGLAEAGTEAIENAVNRAHARGFIDDLPAGLQTVVGDDGVLLSGGQRQRVAIARAFLKDAPILILDEATSALDAESERYIQEALDEVMRGRTTIVIAHRLSTIESADVILVMDNGRIVESGDHVSLLAEQGLYAMLYQAQFDEGTLPESDHISPAQRGVTPRRITAPQVERALGPLATAWYSGAHWTAVLAPLSWVFSKLAKRRRLKFLTGTKPSWRAPVATIVVGNITAGGTGKTPFVIWLVQWLKDHGYRPGIVSRGYGGRGGKTPLAVHADNDPEDVGDEPVLLAGRTDCPVVIGHDRVEAAKLLLEIAPVDIIVADDGLQHYALSRDIEIAVIDGHRGVGNGRCLPAGPLREPVSRLEEVDWVIANGRATGLVDRETVMTVLPLGFVRVSRNSSERMTCEAFVERYHNVHAVAGVGNPARFALTLKELGLTPMLHPYDDHHRYDGSELEFDTDWPVVCTEKDAVKIRYLARIPDDCWYLEIAVRLPAESESGLMALLEEHGISGG
ncbi:MAG: lipid A export permease/ATP-binding protein MsbA [Gammaproteobacteria bacterium]|nr:lipid A export permease/ATP-binding protein MsbA [Gammaproteobacteria bacterium]